MTRPIADITVRDVKAVIQAIADRGLAGQAHQVFNLTRGFFNWAVDSGDFGIETSPCAKLKPKILIGEKVTGDRVLSDSEIAAYWRAAEATPYPDGPFLRLLMLTACRRGEIAELQWREINLASLD